MGSSPLGLSMTIAAVTAIRVATAATMFHVAKVVSVIGTSPNSSSSRKLPGVAAARGPEPE